MRRSQIYQLFLGFMLLVLGALAASNSLHIVERAVRVWPHTLDRRGAETMASHEFLVRFEGLVIVLIGIGMILVETVST